VRTVKGLPAFERPCDPQATRADASTTAQTQRVDRRRSILGSRHERIGPTKTAAALG
jgi:hypothetical protein